jgi:CRISPR-associated protein Cmr2
VQDFISAARATRDLWYGSHLLSELSREAAKTLRDYPNSHNGISVELIFPAADAVENDEASIVNKILARVTANRQEIETIGVDVRKALTDLLVEQWDKVLKEIEAQNGKKQSQEEFRKIPFSGANPTKSLLNEVKALEQIDDLIEFLWAAVPEKEDVKDEDQRYKTARDRAEALLAERKNTKDFHAPTWGAPIPKSSIDGARESVLQEEIYEIKQTSSTKEERDTYLHRVFGIRGAERLCAIGLLKRRSALKPIYVAHEVPDVDEENIDAPLQFLSTSHVAALPLIKRWEKLYNEPDASDQRVASFIKKLKDAGVSKGDLGCVPNGSSVFKQYDGHLLFAERLADMVSGKADELSKALRTFLNEMGGNEPQPYYALLHADGDFMGAAISQIVKAERHQAFSQQLSGFALSVREIVENDHHAGSLVYAGGDDVLAFLPLHTVLPCARALQEAFQKQMAQFPAFNEAGEEGSPTLSAGIAIVHHLEPLSEALDLARAAEKTAKSVRGAKVRDPLCGVEKTIDKAGIAITANKRSGSAITVFDNGELLAQRLDRFVEWYRSEHPPARGLPYEWRELARLFDCDDEATQKSLDKALRYEAVRVLSRKRESGSDKFLGEEMVEELDGYLQSKIANGSSSNAAALRSLCDELIVAKLLADTQELAGCDPVKPRLLKEDEDAR